MEVDCEWKRTGVGVGGRWSNCSVGQGRGARAASGGRTESWFTTRWCMSLVGCSSTVRNRWSIRKSVEVEGRADGLLA